MTSSVITYVSGFSCTYSGRINKGAVPTFVCTFFILIMLKSYKLLFIYLLLRTHTFTVMWRVLTWANIQHKGQKALNSAPPKTCMWRMCVYNNCYITQIKDESFVFNVTCELISKNRFIHCAVNNHHDCVNMNKTIQLSTLPHSLWLNGVY